jgi:hypothetical protein
VAFPICPPHPAMTVEWNTQEEIQKDGGEWNWQFLASCLFKFITDAFAKFMHTLLGLYMFVALL